MVFKQTEGTLTAVSASDIRECAAGPALLIYVQNKITHSRDGSLDHFVKNIRAYGKISLPDHAVGLGNTGESAKGKQNQNRVEKRLTGIVNSACDLQNTPIYVQKLCVGVTKRYENDVKQIEKDHIAA